MRPRAAEPGSSNAGPGGGPARGANVQRVRNPIVADLRPLIYYYQW